jgi:hypothetical protein
MSTVTRCDAECGAETSKSAFSAEFEWFVLRGPVLKAERPGPDQVMLEKRGDSDPVRVEVTYENALGGDLTFCSWACAAAYATRRAEPAAA